MATKLSTKKETTAKRVKGSEHFPISDVERHQMICELAYKKAQARDFKNGNQDQDWAEAEKEIDQKIHFVK